MLTVALIIAAELFYTAGAELPDLTAVLLIGVIVAVFTGNVLAVVGSAILALAYSVWSLPTHGQFALRSGSTLALASDTVVVATVAWLGLWLRRNLEAASHLGTLNTKLNEQLHRLRAEALKTQERMEDLEDFVEHATLGLHRVDSDGIILWANQAELDLLGYTREEYVGRHIADFHANADTIADILTRLTAGEELHSYEACLRCKDGSIRYVLISSNVLQRHSKFVHTRCFTRDITERKQAEMALQDRERTLDLIFRQGSECVFVTDDAGRYLDVNDCGAALLGYERDELLQMSISDVIFPADKSDAAGEIAALREGQPMQGTWRLRKRDGSEVRVEYSAARLDNNRLVSVVRDVTERERLAGAASAIEAEARRLIESQQAQFSLSRLLSETDSALGSAPTILELLAGHIGAQVASLWLVGEHDSLRSASTYLSDARIYGEFAEITRNIVFKPGSGLPGRAARSLRPEWVYDIASDTNFPRAPYAQRAGLQSACAVPLMGADGPIGVIDFLFGSQIASDGDTLTFLGDAAHRIGIVVERELAQRAQREGARRSQALFEQSGAGVAQTDVDGHLITVNQRFCELLGYEQSDLLGRNLRDLAHRQDASRYVLELGRLWAGDVEHMKQDLRFRRADGGDIWAALSVSVVRDDHGVAKYTVAVLQDVTAQVLAKEAAREQRDYLRAVIDNSPMTLAAVDTAGVYQLFIGNALDPLGVTTADRLGSTIYDTHADTPQTLQGYERALAGETVSFIRKELGLVFSILITPHRDSEGAVIGAVALATDITGQQQAEEALLASEERFKRLLYALPTAIYTTDNLGIITLYNDQAADLWGRQPELGKELWCGSWKIYNPDGSPMELDECPMARTLRNGKGVRGEEIVVERPDGTRRHVLPYPEPLYDSEGELIGAVNMLVDITDRKASEDRLRTAEVRLQAMLQFAPLILIEIDKDGIVELIIGSGLNETDTDGSASIGTSVYDQNRDKPDRIALFERALAGEVVDTLLTEGEMAFKTLMAPKYDADGELAGVIAVLTSVSDLFRAQRALETSEEQYRDLVQTSQDLIFALDTDGRWAFINDAAEKILGYTPEEMIGTHFWDLLPEEDRESVRTAYRGIGPGESWFQYEQCYIARDGHLVDLLITSKVRMDAEGTVTGLTGTASDVTARKRVELELRKRDEMLRTVLTRGPLVLALTDLDGRVQFAMGSILERLGMRSEDLVGRTVAEIYPERGDLQDMMQRIEQGEQIHTTLRLGAVDLKLFATPFYDEHGAITGALSLHVDITDQKAIEEQLREREAFLSGVLDSSPMILTLMDLDGVIRLSMGSSRTSSGIMPGDLTGRSVYEMYGREPGAVEWFERARGGESYTIQYQLGALTYQVSAGPYRDSSGAIAGVLSVATDVTELKRTEEGLREFEGRIQQTQKLESLGVLAGGVAHDLNNLLVGIMGYAELTQMSLPPDSLAHPNLEQISLASQHASELANQMLAYAGKGQFVVRPLNLNQLVAEMAYLLQSIVSRNAELRLNLSEEQLTIEGDSAQLRQIVMNLITNASDALGDETGSITLESGVLDVDRDLLSQTYYNDDLPEGRYCYLEVTDTGCGMDAETRQRIFDPFFTTKFTGRGLGLAATLGIVRGHRGAIRVTSEPGAGTTIQLLLPLVAGGTPDDRTGSQTPEALPIRGSGCVLLVDDDATVRTVARTSLELHGFRVREAENGTQGVELFREHSAELVAVLLDLTMPGLSGGDAFAAILQIDPRANVILMSGYSESESLDSISSARPVPFVHKPFKPRELAEAVLRSLQPQQEPEPAEA